MTQKKSSLFFILIFLVLASLIFLYVYINRSEPDTTQLQTSQVFTSNELLSNLENKGQKLAHFIEKAIEIEGEIKEITFQDGKYSLILKGNSDKTYILCEMQPNQNHHIAELKAGQEVKLKGILKGFLMDVILLHCVIV
ncbi:hypothetical protein KAOT1_09751 [Kordia algicida OT-1]|uniref:tRNA_anti-like n=2 Tax=Kordia TaxID=221065 RepID=A9E4C3_9FLAO|nr:hypothetical protein [Kordia algicida]EDP95347.1 hypothetical protein KAOT1_09751 [Kordia algicida OT-1]